MILGVKIWMTSKLRRGEWNKTIFWFVVISLIVVFFPNPPKSGFILVKGVTDGRVNGRVDV